MSPERIAPRRFGFKDSRPTKPSDCYALGMVIYEIMSGNLPFHRDIDIAVSMKVVEGEHPPRGVRFTTNLWEVLELCWASKPDNRPSVEEVLQCLEVASNSPEPPPPRVDDEVEEDGGESEEDGDESDLTADSLDTPTWISGLGFSPHSIPPIIPPSRSNLHVVEQVLYRYRAQQKGWEPQPSIEFRVQGTEGIKLTDALNIRFNGPDGRDDLMFTHDSTGSSVSCRIAVRGFCVGTPTITQSLIWLVHRISRVWPKAGAANLFPRVRLME